jgi:hypothetical protein
MPTQRYTVTQLPVATLFSWIQSKEIAIPEIQRPFVWDATQVRNLLDSLMQGYPVGYLIAWRNPDVRLKDGTTSAGKRILIDGQQRVTALMAALLGEEVTTKEYDRVRIRIAFLPSEKRFEVFNPAIARDKAWIPDVALIFNPNTSLFNLVNEYCLNNPGLTQLEVFQNLEQLRGITNNQLGLIDLASELDIETVTEIFIRVNSAGVTLSQADFAMSKIAVNEDQGGHTLRKAIDYFCHLAVHPDFFSTIQTNDAEFAKTAYFTAMSWLRNETDDLFDPSYTDLLRVAFTSEFRRGRLQDLVALLSGRNFETRQFEEVIVEDSFKRLKKGVLRFMKEIHFKRLIMIIRSAGFVDPSMISSQNALNFAYILYLTLREFKMKGADIEREVRRWFVMSVLTLGMESYAKITLAGALSDAFWTATLPQALEVSAASSPLFRVFMAAQIKLGDKGFLSRDISVRELVEGKSDVHHIFPREFLKANGLLRGQYNQVANYVVAQSEINIAIGRKEPKVYMSEVLAQCNDGKKKYGNFTKIDELRVNLAMNCVPEGVEKMGLSDYPEFLAQRRSLMAARMRLYFEGL